MITKRSVGFVGLGNMGRGMAFNVLNTGFPTVVYDIRPEPVDSLVEVGALGAKSLREVGQVADIVVVTVLNFDQTRGAVLGPSGLCSGLKPGATVAVCSTISPAETRQLGEELAQRGVHYLDAPVSGGKGRADDGTLAMMVGSEPAVFAEQRPVLDAMASNIYYCGPVGMGQVAKMCNQLLTGVGLAATAECLALAAAAGIDRQLLYEIVTQSTGDSWVFRNRGAAMIDGDERLTYRLDGWLKDLDIVLGSADKLHRPLFVANAARHWIQLAVAEGYGAEDWSSVIKPMERLTEAALRSR